MLAPVTLENIAVRLEPLTIAHCDDLAKAAADGELWNLPYTLIPPPEGMRAYVEQALAAQRAVSDLPFVIRLQPSAVIVGTTRYLHVAEEHKRLEIGATWIARSWQGTAVNPSCKLLLLDHAFTALGMNRVEFLTHAKNTQSRAAIAKLGATQEGILRSHRVQPDGSLRDSVVFSIIAAEWPALRQRLKERISSYQPRPTTED